MCRRKIIILILLGCVALSLIITHDTNFGNSSLPGIDGAKVLIIVADGVDWLEYSDVRNILIDQGATVLAASYEKEELHGHYGEGSIVPNLTFMEVNVSDYDAFFVPGGLSPQNLLADPRSETMLNLVREANDKHLILSAICHGPWVLANASIVEAKNGTGHPEVKQYWTAAGGIWTYPKMVERDGNLLTARYEGLEEFKEALGLALQPSLIGDINSDGIVDICDVVIVASAFGSKSGDPNWNEEADLNSDDVVDIFDVVNIAGNFGATTWRAQITFWIRIRFSDRAGLAIRLTGLIAGFFLNKLL